MHVKLIDMDGQIHSISYVEAHSAIHKPKNSNDFFHALILYIWLFFHEIIFFIKLFDEFF